MAIPFHAALGWVVGAHIDRVRWFSEDGDQEASLGLRDRQLLKRVRSGSKSEIVLCFIMAGIMAGWAVMQVTADRERFAWILGAVALSNLTLALETMAIVAAVAPNTPEPRARRER